MTNIWTKLTVIFLVLIALASVSAISAAGITNDFLLVALESLLTVVLVVVVWKETEWGALLVTLSGLAISGISFLDAYLLITPEFGPQSIQYGYAAFLLIIPLFSYLSYRRIRKEGAKPLTTA